MKLTVMTRRYLGGEGNTAKPGGSRSQNDGVSGGHSLGGC